MKTCFKCGVAQPLSAFYKHAGMADGHLNKCKACAKSDALQHRSDNLEKVRAYDRDRGDLPHRVAARSVYAATAEGKAARLRASGSYNARNPERKAANNAVSNAIRDRRLFKLPCWVCGAKRVEGHHPAYSMPLDVVWLCKSHHQQLHNDHDDIERAAA